MDTPHVTVKVDATEAIEAIAEASAELEVPAGCLVIPVADLPAGSVVQICITVGAQTSAAVAEPAPELPQRRPRAMMGTGPR